MDTLVTADKKEFEDWRVGDTEMVEKDRLEADKMELGSQGEEDIDRVEPVE